MSFDLERIYKLLPALYRLRDTETGLKLLAAKDKSSDSVSDESSEVSGPLKAILAIITEQIAALEENLDQLYDDQFIETCAEWVIPYLGDLVGTRPLNSIPGITDGRQRAEVANTIGYRRRKGTASILEQLARDVTGWDANVVEYFQGLSTTQYMKHLRPENKVTVDLRNKKQLAYVDSAFDKLSHSVDVRRIETKGGRYNIQNIGIFLWRLKSFSLTQSPAYKLDNQRYTFDALGKGHPVVQQTRNGRCDYPSCRTGQCIFTNQQRNISSSSRLILWRRKKYNGLYR